jgi:hypothetical protein
MRYLSSRAMPRNVLKYLHPTKQIGDVNKFSAHAIEVPKCVEVDSLTYLLL